MASTKHLELSDFIKQVHQTLRDESKSLGSEEAWRIHCKNEQQLQQYAEAMKNLATKFWESNRDVKAVSRILWTSEICWDYFKAAELEKHRRKELEIAQKLNIDLNIENEMANYKTDKIVLLDVGSCYNPFSEFEYFEVLPIDIAPALPEVYKCDFLNITLDTSTEIIENKVNSIKENSFHVVVFSLLLEYLPSPEFRLRCCENAYSLLQNEGLLIIITPDSNHVGANAKLMKTWRYILAKIGFSRIKYVKLTHLHCMAFRKNLRIETAKRWADLYNKDDLYDKIYIPQDFKRVNVEVQEKICKSDENNDCLFDQLPFLMP